MLFATSISTGQIFRVDTVAHSATPVLNTVALDSLIFDPTGRIVYTELSNGIVAAFNPNTNTNVNLASGLAQPIDIALEPSLTSVLVSDASSNQLSRVSLAGGVLATLNLGLRPDGITYDSSGNLFVNVSTGFTANNSQVKRIDPTTGATLATTGNTGLFFDGLTFDSFTGFLYATDYNNGRIVRINPTTMAFTVLTPLGPGIPGGGPDGITSDGQGNLFLASRANGEVVQYNIATNTASNIVFISGLDDLAPASGLGAPSSAAPEPASLLLAGLGAATILGYRFGRRRGSAGA
jgi:sugar lactone lactonase YvrE